MINKPIGFKKQYYKVLVQQKECVNPYGDGYNNGCA